MFCQGRDGVSTEKDEGNSVEMSALPRGKDLLGQIERDVSQMCLCVSATRGMEVNRSERICLQKISEGF